MKILQINAVYGVGSTGTIVEDIHNLCLARGIESCVAYSTSPIPQKDIKNGYAVGNTLGKKTHAFLSRIGGKQAYFSSHATNGLIKYIERERPDIVHLHNLHSNFLHLNRLLEYLAVTKTKTVITLHDCWFYTGGCFHYTTVDCFKWLQGCGNCPKKNVDTPAYFKDNSASILQDRRLYFGRIKDLTVIGVSEWITEEAKRSVISAKRYETVHNGIDVEFFKPTDSDIRKQLGLEGKFVVLGMANKWLLPVNAATLKKVAEGIGDDAVLLLVGCNKGEEAKLPKNVIPYGYINDKELLRKVYSAADVFANCTREESLSLVNVEAQSCGTPVVTYRSTGAKETVDGLSGFAVKWGSAEEMLDKILEIKRVGKQEFSQKCRAYVTDKFERNKNYERLLDLYKEING